MEPKNEWEQLMRMKDQAAAKAWVDDEFRKKLLADPSSCLQATFGFVAPAGVTVRVVEEDAGSLTILIPAKASTGQLSDAQLDAVAGGWGCYCDCFTTDCFAVGCK